MIRMVDLWISHNMTLRSRKLAEPWEITILLCKSTISMALFNSYVELPVGHDIPNPIPRSYIKHPHGMMVPTKC